MHFRSGVDIATVQGAAYGMSPYIRVSYATDEASLREGCRRIQTFCRGLTPSIQGSTP